MWCGPYKTCTGAQRRRCTSKSAKNHRKLSDNYGIGLQLGLGIGLGLVFRFSDTQRHYGAVVCFTVLYGPVCGEDNKRILNTPLSDVTTLYWWKEVIRYKNDKKTRVKKDRYISTAT